MLVILLCNYHSTLLELAEVDLNPALCFYPPTILQNVFNML